MMSTTQSFNQNQINVIITDLSLISYIHRKYFKSKVLPYPTVQFLNFIFTHIFLKMIFLNIVHFMKIMFALGIL